MFSFNKSFALVLLLMGTAPLASHAGTYNTCTEVGNPKSGVYFDQGYAKTSPNSSEHYYEDMVLVINGTSETYKIGGDNLYRAACELLLSGTNELSLDKSHYRVFDRKYEHHNGTIIELSFDLNNKSKINGHVKRTLTDGTSISFDLNCEK